jgi:hypothetical protein
MILSVSLAQAGIQEALQYVSKRWCLTGLLHGNVSVRWTLKCYLVYVDNLGCERHTREKPQRISHFLSA